MIRLNKKWLLCTGLYDLAFGVFLFMVACEKGTGQALIGAGLVLIGIATAIKEEDE